MPDDTQRLTPQDDSLDGLLAEYVAGEDAGQLQDRQAILARYPRHAAELREFFVNRDQMRRLAAPLRGVDAASSNQASGRSLGKLRYFGDYELLEEIAAGGMGIVYKARQVSLSRIVAVKMMLKGTLATEDDVKRFRAEAEAAASLQHPAIVAIHEVGLHEGQHYFSMDYVDGPSLAELPREQPLSGRQAGEYLRDAAEAVHYAHQHGTLHRDLKPSNILIDRQRRVRITDFGLAKRIEDDSELTLTGQVLGTPSYMPPEQALGKRSLVSAASDIYSLGAVLYELLAGRPPFRGESPAETLRQVESLDPVAPRLLNPATPRDLETICLKCLEKEPHKRYGTAQLLADDLGRFLRGEPIVARPIRPWQRVAKWARRHPTAVALVAMSIVALVATMGLIVGQTYNAGLKTLNDQLASAKTRLESRNEQLSTAKASLEISNRELGDTSTRLEKAYDEVKMERARARSYLYAARMALVQRAEQEKQPARIVQLLRSVIPETPDQEDLRDFEWQYLWRKYQGEESRLHGHTGPVIAVAFSLDDKWIASGCADGSIKLWDAANGREIREFICSAATMTAIHFTSDSKVMAVKLQSGAVVAWNIQSGDVVPMSDETWKQLGATSVAQERSANGQVSVITSSKGTRKVIARTEYRDIIRATVTVHDIGTEKPVMSRDVPTGLTKVASSRDGRMIAAAGLDLAVRIWDVSAGAEVCTLHTEHEIRSVSFSSDGSRIAAGIEDGTLMVWSVPGMEIRTLQQGSTFRESHPQATCVSFGGGGQIVAAVCGTRAICWDVVTGKQLSGLPVQSEDRPGRQGYNRIALSPEGSLIVGVQPDDSALAGTAGLRVASVSPGFGYGFGFSNDESLVAGAFNTQVAVWTTDGGQRIHSFKVPSWASCVAFSPDNHLLAGGSGSQLVYQPGTLHVWNLETGQNVFPSNGNLLGVWGAAFSPDGKFLAVAMGNYGDYGANVGRVWVLDTETWKVVRDLRGHSGCVWSVAFSPSGKRLASAAGHWRSPRRPTSNAAAKGSAPAGGQPPDLTALAQEPGEVIIWDVMTGYELATFRDDRNGMYGVAFSADGRRLATASKSGAVRVFDGTPLAHSPAYEPLPEE